MAQTVTLSHKGSASSIGRVTPGLFLNFYKRLGFYKSLQARCLGPALNGILQI